MFFNLLVVCLLAAASTISTASPLAVPPPSKLTLSHSSLDATSMPTYNVTASATSDRRSLQARQNGGAQTIRKYWGPQSGRVSFNFNWPAINHDSVVLVTAAQYQATVPASSEHRYIGGAALTVESIVPHGPPYDANHGVSFVVNIDSPTPVTIVTDITVLSSTMYAIQYL